MKVAGSAVDDAARALNVGARTVELSSDDVSRLAANADVSDDVVRRVAPEVDHKPTWDRVVSGLTTVDRASDGHIRSVALGMACDAVNGDIRTEEDLYRSLANQLVELTQQELRAVYDATRELWQDLYDALTGPDPELRATAVIACYTVEQIS